MDPSIYRERAILVGAYVGSSPDRELLDELSRLTETAGADEVGRIEQVRDKPEPATFIGKGKVEELAELVRRLKADVVIFDVDLSPSQVRNLEEALDTKVIDRTELILDIFANHARTNAAQLQVELAQLEYIYPRLLHMWKHLEKIEGGIGTRGPGERQIESDRRMVRRRIDTLKKRLREVEGRRAREVQRRADATTISLVGYTNAGKSSLMNALTGSNVKVADALFVTLDTRTRKWDLGPGRTALLSDTVGFIRGLPHHLVTSFYATLEEARHADLLIHVVDVASPHALHQAETVRDVLKDLGCNDRPSLLVLNKCDLPADHSCVPLFGRNEDVVLVSAMTGERLDDLRVRTLSALDAMMVQRTVSFDLGNGRLQAFIASHGRVVDTKYFDTTASVELLMRPADLGSVAKLGGRVQGGA